jgi:hypothetical protein
MRSLKSIKYKAAFLLTVFTLNTVISFACSVGLDMGFNSSHHSHEKRAKRHSHGAKHTHGSHSHTNAHKHSAPPVAIKEKGSDQKDNCCNTKAVELQKLDKSSDHASAPVIKVPVLISLLTAFAGLEIRAESSVILSKTFIPQYYPPPDKRIIIQSFQI